MPYYNRDPKRDHHFDNHPYRGHGVMLEYIGQQGYIGDYVCRAIYGTASTRGV